MVESISVPEEFHGAGEVCELAQLGTELVVIRLDLCGRHLVPCGECQCAEKKKDEVARRSSDACVVAGVGAGRGVEAG